MNGLMNGSGKQHRNKAKDQNVRLEVIGQKEREMDKVFEEIMNMDIGTEEGTEAPMKRKHRRGKARNDEGRKEESRHS